MDKKLKAKWVKALRSGKYTQTTGVMKDKEGFCCLGVLRHITHPHSTLEDEEEFILHPKHCEEFGLTKHVQKLLARLNDGYHGDDESKHCDPHNFVEIADYIEANL